MWPSKNIDCICKTPCVVIENAGCREYINSSSGLKSMIEFVRLEVGIRTLLNWAPNVKTATLTTQECIEIWKFRAQGYWHVLTHALAAYNQYKIDNRERYVHVLNVPSLTEGRELFICSKFLLPWLWTTWHFDIMNVSNFMKRIVLPWMWLVVVDRQVLCRYTHHTK